MTDLVQGRLPKPEARDNNFDAIRLAMAVLVIFSHAFPLATGQQLWGGSMVSLGALAVAVFFMVSGYLISMSWERSRSLRHYMSRRAARILPGFVVAFTLCAWLVGPLASDRPLDWFTPEAVKTNLLRLALLHHVEGHSFLTNPYPLKVNASLWTIRFEFWCYLLLAGAGMLGLIRRKWAVAGVMAVSWGLLIAWFNAWLPIGQGETSIFIFGWIGNWVEFGTWFISGATIYAFRKHIRYDGRVAAVAAIMVAIPFVRQDLSYMYLWPPGLAYLVFWLAFTPAIKTQGVMHRLNGDYSYGLYLYSFPVQQICVKWLGFAGQPLLLFVASLGISTVLAVLSWRYIERPWLVRPTPRPAPAPAPAADPALVPEGALVAGAELS